jgi:hypothetical protein
MPVKVYADHLQGEGRHLIIEPPSFEPQPIPRTDSPRYCGPHPALVKDREAQLHVLRQFVQERFLSVLRARAGRVDRYTASWAETLMGPQPFGAPYRDGPLVDHVRRLEAAVQDRDATILSLRKDLTGYHKLKSDYEDLKKRYKGHRFRCLWQYLSFFLGGFFGTLIGRWMKG